jgi:hypothetical protein
VLDSGFPWNDDNVKHYNKITQVIAFSFFSSPPGSSVSQA